ncbi:glycoside hydrolase [Arenibacter sp. ARW7G5Y1]|uniref:glycoside hydrolase n=1 Tax=Arenibacter sp. ARW7G5Y1 TaxID=2135619 RepID=UPI000D752926|nr:glycoside hydrolase [Arenibacter sp. ARW7G5Y1]PXX31176.1 O-glycosyl hydrolase [Arenibacter sp. ARW7G5Y1]
MNIFKLLLGLVLILPSSCEENESYDKNSNNQIIKNHVQLTTIDIDAKTEFQTLEHFGASDAWSCQYIGNWPNEKKEAIANLLFSNEVDVQGNPLGIGLSLWRFNIGAGSASQGASSNINDEWRRTESFLQKNGTYDWSKQRGQLWFAQAAKTKGVDKLLVFPNSPHINFTKNGRANADGAISNLTENNYETFGDYLANVIEGLQNLGLTVDYVSPVNEPQWDWADGQEGSPFFNDEIAAIVRSLNTKLIEKNITTKIDIAEAGQLNFLYEKGNKGDRGNQINEFFSTGSSNYIGDLTNVSHTISGHSYFTTYPFSTLIEKRTKLAEKIKSTNGLRFWMSEYTILEDNVEIKGQGRDLGINPALYIAKVIHSDLAIANATAWHWWLAISPYDYKDGLIYVDKNKHDGNYHESKMLWALGNYSRFIKPGYKRIKLTSQANSKDIGSLNSNFLFSGYKNPHTNEAIVVLVNSGSDKKNIQLEHQGEKIIQIKSYVTSNGKNLEFVDLIENDMISIPGKSIVTITIDSL